MSLLLPLLQNEQIERECLKCGITFYAENKFLRRCPKCRKENYSSRILERGSKKRSSASLIYP